MAERIDARLATAYFIELIERFAEDYPDDWEQLKDTPFEPMSDLIAMQYAPDLLGEPFPLMMERHLRRIAKEKRRAEKEARAEAPASP